MFARPEMPDKVGARDFLMPLQSFPGQQNPPFFLSHTNDGFPGPGTAIQSVKSQRAQSARKAAQPPAHKEANIAQRRRAHAHKRLHVERFKDRVDTDKIAVFEAMRKVHRFAVDEHHLDFCAWHAKVFQNFPNRLRRLEPMRESALPFIRRQEIVQFLI